MSLHVMRPKPVPQSAPAVVQELDEIEFEELLSRCQRGDASAQAALYRAFYGKVRSDVQRSLRMDVRWRRPWVTALFSTGDVVQEVFKAVLADLHSIHSSSRDAFAAYLARVTRNRIVDAVRFHEAACRDARRQSAVEIQFDATGGEADPSAVVAHAEEVAAFIDALATFSDRERMLLRERLEKVESFGALASLLGYPTADAARKAFYVAQARLLVRLRSYGVTGPGEES